MIFRFIGILVGLYILLFLAGAFPKTFATFVLLVILYVTWRNFISQTRKAIWFSKWATIRRIRRARGAFHASPNAVALYSGCLAFACVVPLVAQFSSVYLQITFSALSGICLCLGTIIDWYCRLQHMLASRITKRIALTILGFLGTITIFLSNVVSNHFVTYIAKANPANMPEFVRLGSALIYPFSLAVVISAGLVLVMTMQSIVMLAAVFVTSMLRNLPLFATSTFQRKVENIGYRLLTGTRPRQSQRWWEKWIGGLPYFIRPLGTGTVALVIVLTAYALFEMVGYVPLFYLQRALIVIEYHTPHLCEAVDPSALISFQNDGYVSVAKKNGAKYSFSLEKCHK